MIKIKDIKEIPRLPQVSMEVIRHAFSDEPDIQKVAQIVERDPVLTAKLFETVNSASFGLRVKVSSVSQAISIIGLDALRSTVVSLALGDYFISNARGNALDPRRFCLHSLSTAVIMQKTAEYLKVPKADRFYLVGLLHNLGKFALDSIPESRYGEVLELVREGRSFEESEQRIFRLDNRQVWMLLARNWGFPEDIIALYKGEARGETRIKTQKLIADSSRQAERMGYVLFDDGNTGEPRDKELFSALSEEELVSLGLEVEKQVKIMAEVMDLPLPDPEQVTRTLLRVTHQVTTMATRYIRTSRELKLRVEELEELTRVFTGIIRSYDGDSLSFSVLESLMEGFHLDGAFLLMRKTKGGFSGYAARCDDDGVPDIDVINLESSQLSFSMEKCINCREPIAVAKPYEEEAISRCLGSMPLVWLAPVHVRGNFSCLIGIGVKDEHNAKLNNKDFGKILNIVAGEIGLSLDNSQLFNRVRKEARVDALTGLFNRRTIMKILASEFARYQRKPAPLSLAIFDMDHFKAINDTRGHLAGDEFLVQVSRIFKEGIRESDFIGRYGGDEFIAVFPDTEAANVRVLVERLREQLLAYCAEFEGPDLGVKLTVSVGVAGARPESTDAYDLIKNADEALYAAKEAGRDCCFIFGEREPVTA